MTIEFYNLPMHLHKAENAQQVQNLFLMQERAGLELAQAANEELTRGDLAKAVEGTRDTRQGEIQDDGEQNPQAQSEQQRQSREESEPDAPPPPDPDGRGSYIDAQA